MSKVISRLLWFCITKLCDWLTKLAPLSQPMRSKTKTNRVFAAWRQLHVFASNSDWLVVLFTSVAIGQSKYFGFGFTPLNWKPLYSNTVIIEFIKSPIRILAPHRLHTFVVPSFPFTVYCLLSVHDHCQVISNKHQF